MNKSQIEVGKKFKPKDSDSTVVEVVHITEKSVLFSIVECSEEEEMGREESCSWEDFMEDAVPHIEIDPNQIVMELDIESDVIPYESAEGFLALAVKGTDAEKRCEASPEYIKRKLT